MNTLNSAHNKYDSAGHKHDSVCNKYESARHKRKSACNKYESAGHKRNSATNTARTIEKLLKIERRGSSDKLIPFLSCPYLS